MKIMMIAACDSIHTVRWANAFADRDEEVHVVAIANHRVKSDSIDNRVHIHYLKHGGYKGYFLNSFELHRLWKKINPNIVNVHYATGYGILGRISRINPIVLSVWGSDVYGYEKRSAFMKRMIRKTLEHADAIASTSKSMANQVCKITTKYKDEITITPFGVNLDDFTADGEKAFSDESMFVFGTVKKLDFLYGIDYIIKAFDLVYRKWKEEGGDGKEPRLFLCGKGKDIDAFKKLRDDLNLTEQITIEGYIPHDQIPSIIRSLDVFCLGSLSESFGVSALEAMACERPVVASDADGFKEVMIDGVTGFIVPKRDEKALAEKMWELYKDEQLRERMGRAGRQHVLVNYDWEMNVDILLNLLKRKSK